MEEYILKAMKLIQELSNTLVLQAKVMRTLQDSIIEQDKRIKVLEEKLAS